MANQTRHQPRCRRVDFVVAGEFLACAAEDRVELARGFDCIRRAAAD